jgi:formate/nitrite transporter FocA (FNT family)
VRGIFAGWLIALLTWIMSGIKTGEIPLIFILTYIVGISGFPHVVFGSTESFFLVSLGVITWKRALIGYLLPAFLGNTLGGVGFVAIVNHAQVVSGSGHAKARRKNQ